MNMCTPKLLLLFFIVNTDKLSSLQEKVKVSLYYEALCNDCEFFIKDQLYPGYQILGDDALTLEMVPYGNAHYKMWTNTMFTYQVAYTLKRGLGAERESVNPKFKKGWVVSVVKLADEQSQIIVVDGKVKVMCQHGPEECYGNTIQACVLANHTQKTSMDFIGCLAMNNYLDYAKKAEECADKMNLCWASINTCATGDAGYQLLLQLGQKTSSLNPELEYVPHILFNDEFNQIDEFAAMNDFMKVVCGKFTETPTGC